MNIQIINTNGRIVLLLLQRLPSHICIFQISYFFSYFKIIQCPKHWGNEKSFQLAKESCTEHWSQLLVVRKHEMFQAVTSFGSLRNHLQNSTRENFVPCCSLMIVIALLQLHLIILIFFYFLCTLYNFPSALATIKLSFTEELNLLIQTVLLRKRKLWQSISSWTEEANEPSRHSWFPRIKYLYYLLQHECYYSESWTN